MNTPNAIRLDDYALLDIIRKQNAVIVDLEARLTKLEVFTGMVAPAPLPTEEIELLADEMQVKRKRPSRTLRAAFELEDGVLTFAAGQVDEMPRQATGMVDGEELDF